MTTTSTGVADTFGFFSTMMGFFHSSATSVPAWGASRSSSSSYGHTAPGYYSSYSCTSGGSMSFPSLGGIFSSVPHASPSDQSFSSSDAVYSSVQDSACSNTCWNTSNTNTPTLPSTSNTSSSSSSSTYTPRITLGVPVQIVRKNMLINTIVPLFLIYLAQTLIIMHDYFI